MPLATVFFSLVGAGAAPAQPLPDVVAVLADGKRAAESWTATIPLENCAWTGGTYVLGLLEYHKATVDLNPVAPDAASLTYVRRWAEKWQYKICVGWRQESGCMPLAAGTAYTAGAMWSVSGVKSVDDCCDLADSQQRTGCWGYTYRASGGVCSLHTNDNTTTHEAGAVSGWVRQGYGFPPPPSPPYAGKPKPEGKMVNPHNANEQLCGAIYAELFLMDGGTNQSMLADTLAVLGEEIADPDSFRLWSWVDALHMAMSTYSRVGNVTGEAKWHEQQWRMFNFSCLSGCPGNKTLCKAGKGKGRSHCEGYCFWNASDALFYRDENYVESTIYWGRGNGWAIAALVSAIEYGRADPHRPAYIAIFSQLAKKLASLQSTEGAWGTSLLNASGYPTPETTATANFAFGLAYGVNAGLLPRAGYLPVVAKAWHWLSTVALQPSGYVSFCQPGGSHPMNMINRYEGAKAVRFADDSC